MSQERKDHDNSGERGHQNQNRWSQREDRENKKYFQKNRNFLRVTGLFQGEANGGHYQGLGRSGAGAQPKE
jgi:hypothetical protein